MSFSVLVLISGRGSNLRALIQAQARAAYQITAVISSRPEAPGLAHARQARIPALALPHRDFPDRARFDAALAQSVDRYRPDLLVLAGFMRILGDGFVRRYLGRMINIHPSLLPDFTGLDTHARALAAGRHEHGASVHYVTPDLDAGPVIARVRMPVVATDTVTTLAARLLPLEHRLLPYCVELIARGRIQWRKGTVYFDDQALDSPLELPAR